MNMENDQPLLPAPPVNLESAILEQNANMVALKEGCSVGSELPPGLQGNFGGNKANTCTSALHSIDEGEEITCGFIKHERSYDLQNLTMDKSIQVSNETKYKFLAHKPRVGCETAIQNCELASALPDTEFHGPVATISTTGQSEGSDTEINVPNYSDLEALILDLDLIPWDQESDFIQPEVSRFQYPESRKDLIRLEKGVCSYMNRSIMSKGAFAILYGQRTKYYIREPEAGKSWERNRRSTC
ncbi:Forkhead-associated (FHA) domain-containing protein [Zea mays]|uniref:Forkhead-associated (FHA) domain-containing protein n=1 Tax=Zea mays TaxID=4577 RepID=A0A1D6HUT1_MAIZE|nr:Forkhead-associated (FHA) domain-containing protein [Zea mays]